MNSQETQAQLEAYFDFLGDDLPYFGEPVEILPPELQIALEYTRSQIGIPFRINVQGPEIGPFHDCSSLTQAAFNKALGLENAAKNDQFARTTLHQGIYWGRDLGEGEELAPGDLIFYRTDSGYFNDAKGFPDGVGHVAIYTGNGMAIHAAGDVGNVVEQSLDEILSSRIKEVGRKRVIEGDVYYHEGHAKPLPGLPTTGRVE